MKSFAVKKLRRSGVGDGFDWALLVIALVLILPACGGSEAPSTTKRDASFDGNDAALDAPRDTVGVSSKDSAPKLDTVLRLDVSKLDTAPVLDSAPDLHLDSILPPPQDAAAAVDIVWNEVAAIDTGDTGTLIIPDAEDAAPTINLDASQDYLPDAQVIVVDSLPPVDLSDVALTDLANDTSVPLFSCAGREPPAAGVLRQVCYDFSNASSTADFLSEAGTWVVADGTYRASEIPSQVTCVGDGTVMSSSVLRNFTAEDVRIHATMSSIDGVDKVVVLRSRLGGNRMELNFRSTFTYEGVVQGGDFSIYEVINCVTKTYVDANTILIPHAIGQSIDVDIQLIGAQLKVVVDGKQVFNDTLLGVKTTAGTVGFATFPGAEPQFDNFFVEVLK